MQRHQSPPFPLSSCSPFPSATPVAASPSPPGPESAHDGRPSDVRWGHPNLDECSQSVTATAERGGRLWWSWWMGSTLKLQQTTKNNHNSHTNYDPRKAKRNVPWLHMENVTATKHPSHTKQTADTHTHIQIQCTCKKEVTFNGCAHTLYKNTSRHDCLSLFTIQRLNDTLHTRTHTAPLCCPSLWHAWCGKRMQAKHTHILDITLRLQ